MIGIAFKSHNRHIGADIDSGGGMDAFIEARHDRINNTGEHTICCFQNCHIKTVLLGDSGNFKTNIATAHDDHAGTGFEMALDFVDIAHRAQVMHAFKIEARDVDLAHATAGGDQKFCIGDDMAVAGRHGFCFGINCGDARAEHQCAMGIGVKFGGFQLDAVKADFTGEKFLAERRALIGWFGLVADECDCAFKAFRTQTDDGL